MNMRLIRFVVFTLVSVGGLRDEYDDDVDMYCERICNSLSGNRDHYFSCLYGCRAGFDQKKKNDSTCEDDVRERFEMYPFGRDFDEDGTKDLQGSTNFDMINHFCWKGKRDLCATTSSEPFRMLIVGGGKGYHPVHP